MENTIQEKVNIKYSELLDRQEKHMNLQKKLMIVSFAQMTVAMICDTIIIIVVLKFL